MLLHKNAFFNVGDLAKKETSAFPSGLIERKTEMEFLDR